MPYIGRGPAKSGTFRILDDISLDSHTSGGFNGSRTTFALTVGTAALTVGLPETLIIAVDGVIQEPGTGFTISGSNIVFGSAPQDSATFWGVELGDVGGIADNIVDGKITTAKLASGVLDTDISSVSGSDDTLASAKSIKTYVDAQVTANNLDITDGSTTIEIDANSEALTITSGEGIDATVSGNALTIAGEDATTSNKGVASFNTVNFLVSSGDVTIKDNGVRAAELYTTSGTAGSDTFLRGDETWAAAGGAFTHIGGTATEPTGSSSGAQFTAISASGLTVTAATPLLLTVNSRKTSGAASQCRLSWNFIDGSNNNDDNERAIHSASNQAEAFIGRAWVGARHANYRMVIMTTENSNAPNNTVHHNSGNQSLPMGTITQIDAQGNSLSISQTHSMNYLGIYGHSVT